MTPLSFPSPESIFSAASGLAMIAWIALALSPAHMRWAGAARLFAGRVVPVVLALAYVVLFARNGMADGGYDSIAAVRRLFAVPELFVAGWLHFLAFDLFVGAWIAEHAAEIGLPHLVLLPLFALTFMFGPAGLLAFVALRGLVHLWRQPRDGVGADAA